MAQAAAVLSQGNDSLWHAAAEGELLLDDAHIDTPLLHALLAQLEAQDPSIRSLWACRSSLSDTELCLVLLGIFQRHGRLQHIHLAGNRRLSAWAALVVASYLHHSSGQLGGSTRSALASISLAGIKLGQTMQCTSQHALLQRFVTPKAWTRPTQDTPLLATLASPPAMKTVAAALLRATLPRGSPGALPAGMATPLQLLRAVAAQRVAAIHGIAMQPVGSPGAEEAALQDGARPGALTSLYELPAARAQQRAQAYQGTGGTLGYGTERVDGSVWRSTRSQVGIPLPAAVAARLAGAIQPAAPDPTAHWRQRPERRGLAPGSPRSSPRSVRAAAALELAPPSSGADGSGKIRATHASASLGCEELMPSELPPAIDVLCTALALSCPELTEVDLSHCDLSTESIATAVMGVLLASDSVVVPRLQVLALSGNRVGASAAMLSLLLRGQPVDETGVASVMAGYQDLLRKRYNAAAREERAMWQRRLGLEPDSEGAKPVRKPRKDPDASELLMAQAKAAATAAPAALQWALAACTRAVAGAVSSLGSAAHATAPALVKALPKAMKRARRASLEAMHAAPNAVVVDGAASLAAAGLVAASAQRTFARCQLRILELSDAGIPDAAAAMVFRALAGNSSVEEITLARNALGPLAVQEACSMLGSNSTLAALDVGYNPLGWDGVWRLLHAAASGSSLLELCVEECITGGAQEIASMALTSTTATLRTPRSVAHNTGRPKISATPPGAQRSPRGAAGGKRGSPRKRGAKASSTRGAGASKLTSRAAVPAAPAAAPAATAAAAAATATDPLCEAIGKPAAPARPRGDAAMDLIAGHVEYLCTSRSLPLDVCLEWPPRERRAAARRWVATAQAARGEVASSSALWQLAGLQLHASSSGWNIHQSVWRARLAETDARSMYDTRAILDRAFEADWAMTKLARVVRNDTARGLLKEVLKQYFPVIRELFRWYCCSGPTASSTSDVFTMSFNEFTSWRRDSGIECTKGAELDTAFIASNYEAEVTEHNPQHSLMRHEFLEAVARVALTMYPPAPERDSGPRDSMKALVDHHVLPTARSLLNWRSLGDSWSNEFRRQHMYCEAVDRVLRLYSPTLRALFMMYSRTVSSTELASMTRGPAKASQSQVAAVLAGQLPATVPKSAPNSSGLLGAASSNSIAVPGANAEAADDMGTSRIYRKRNMMVSQWISMLRAADLIASSHVLQQAQRTARGKPVEGQAAKWLAARGVDAAKVDGTATELEAAIFTERQACLMFALSIPCVVSELYRDLRSCRRMVPFALTYTSFLEAVVRLAHSSACPSPQSVLSRASASTRQTNATGGITSPEDMQASGLAVDVETGPPAELSKRAAVVVVALARGAGLPVVLSPE